MKRTLFAISIAALTLGAASIAQAAPIAPLPAGVTAAGNGVTHVQWWWRHRHWHHRHCWVGRYGRMHCRYW